MNLKSYYLILVIFLVGAVAGWGASHLFGCDSQAPSSAAVVASSQADQTREAQATSAEVAEESQATSADTTEGAQASSTGANEDAQASSGQANQQASAASEEGASAPDTSEEGTSTTSASRDTTSEQQPAPGDDTYAAAEPSVSEDGTYTSKEEVAAYIHLYGHLPSNYISKTKARKAGWKSSDGNLDDVLPGMSIGGGQFYNDEGLLPDAPGRTWTECDINYSGGYRGAERIVFSNDGLIFYTSDHYESFEQLY